MVRSAVAASEAGGLFVARARAANPVFTLDAGDSAAIAEVCSRLDGMPLAIELAAARCPALGPVQLAARLEGHPGLLSGGAARPGRHRSLDALVSWSYELLSEAERRLLARLSVLRGGFELDVAEQVAGGEPLAPQAVAGLLASLAGKSLVQIQAGPVIRYWLLETVRQFAVGRLAASGEETTVHVRLLRWALEVARSAEAARPGAEGTDWSSRISADQASIRAALSWALGGAEPEAGRELAARLARWWIATGRYSEAGQFLTAAAGIPSRTAPGIDARVMTGAAWSAFHLGDFGRAAPLVADGIACAQCAGEPQLEAWGRNLLAVLAWHAGDADRIVAEIEASRVLSGQADPARAQSLLAMAAFLAGDLTGQERHGLAAVELARTAAGQEGLALALTGPAAAAIAGAGIQPATMAALDEAATVLAAYPDRFTETIVRRLRADLFATLGQFDAAETEVGLCWAAGRGGAVHVVENAAPQGEARLAAARGDTATAIGALRRAADGGRGVGSVMFVPAALAALACIAAIAGDQAAAAAAVAEARAELGGRRQAITAAALRYAEGVMAWHRGELADAEHLVREATLQWHRGSDRMDACDGRKRPATGWASLTPAELEVVRLVGEGLRNDAIARRLV